MSKAWKWVLGVVVGIAVAKVNGSIPVVFADYDISNPSGGPAKTADDGMLEFLVVFEPTAA